jgi:hypothetical protein
MALTPTPRSIGPGRPRTSTPITPIGAAAYLANLGRAADQIGGTARVLL